MRQDVIGLRNFYQRPLGRTAAELIARRVAQFWPDLTGAHVAGIGFAPPLLEHLGDGTASRVALMPAAQGVMHWPDAGRNAAALVDETELPLPNSAYDRIVLVHALEVADDLRGLLREVWRVLSPGGRLIAVVPRRRGAWSGLERTPFGQGRPFSRSQLEDALSAHLLPPTRCAGALYLPPFERFGMVHALAGMEWVGGRWTRGLAGVLIIEAEKQVFGAVPAGSRRRSVPVPVGPVQPA